LIITIFIFFTLFSPTILVNGENVLEISGPVDAYEGEVVEFIITLNGEPREAKVVFEDLSPAKDSNSTTGKVNFTMPTVPYGNKGCNVTASLFGTIFAYHTILVKNRTGLLEIELSTDYIIETEEFSVKITEGGIPIGNAYVWFNSDVYLTDDYGNVSLTAPDVLVTTNYGLTVNKTGYKSSSSMITINSENLGEKLMEIVNPFIVEPGSENVEIKVISEQGGVQGAKIDVYYEGTNIETNTTDENGKTYIDIPMINSDNYISVFFQKEGYSTYNEDEEIIITLFEKEFIYDMFMSVDPSEVYEGELVTVMVSNEVGLGIEKVIIWKGDIELDGSTDPEGILSFIAPSVNIDREYHLYAVKEGYNFAESKVTIRAISSIENELNIETQNSINETENLSIIVKDDSNIVVSDAIVSFNFEEKMTNEYGMVSFTTPNITGTTFFLIKASKSGYLPASFSVEVIDLDGGDGGESTSLHICVEPSVIENDEFKVTIRDNLENLVSGVKLTFKGASVFTDFKGEASFSAPDVSWGDESYKITAVKSGYISDSTEITVKNVEGFQYWYLIIIIAVIIIVGIFAYFRYGRMY